MPSYGVCTKIVHLPGNTIHKIVKATKEIPWEGARKGEESCRNKHRETGKYALEEQQTKLCGIPKDP